MECCIYYEEIEGVNVEWFEVIGIFVFDIFLIKKIL